VHSSGLSAQSRSGFGLVHRQTDGVGQPTRGEVFATDDCESAVESLAGESLIGTENSDA